MERNEKVHSTLSAVDELKTRSSFLEKTKNMYNEKIKTVLSSIEDIENYFGCAWCLPFVQACNDAVQAELKIAEEAENEFAVAVLKDLSSKMFALTMIAENLSKAMELVPVIKRLEKEL